MTNQEFFNGLGGIVKKKTKPQKRIVQTQDEDEEVEVPTSAPKKEVQYKAVEQIHTTVKLIRTFVSMHGKRQDLHRLASFIRRLQKAITERVITKRSPHAKQIDLIQSLAIDAYKNARGNFVKIVLDEDMYQRLYMASRSEKVRPSVGFLKRFVSLIGRPYNRDLREKMERLLTSYELLMSKKMITRDDPYIERVRQARATLRRAMDQGQSIRVPSAELNGLQGMIRVESGDGNFFEQGGEDDFVEYEELNGLPSMDTFSSQHLPAVNTLPDYMTPEQQSQREIKCYPFTGFFGKMLGQPETNFYMVVHGPPFNGKSTFMLLLTKYLSENFGRVLYAWPEQYGGKAATLLCERVGVSNAKNITLCGDLAKVPDIDSYQFLVLDSATDAGYSANDLKSIRERFPMLAIIVVLQSTKSEKFKGEQQWAHNPCIKIKIENRQAIIEKNRFLTDVPKPLDLVIPTADKTELNGLKKKIPVAFDGTPNAKEKTQSKAIVPVPEIKLSFEAKGLEMDKRITEGQAIVKLARDCFEPGEIQLQEQFIVFYLNRKNNLLGYYKHTKGTVSSVVFDTRLIFSTAVKCLASGIIVVHNHPSGGLEPSESDFKMTKAIESACLYFNMRLLDSMIVTQTGYYSLRENGQMQY